ncbi:MAG TPA: tetratricopeptide repeat protein [Spirochaetota bacterium]|nr:tetratricopeptide repeat protein [Spirochaetota bacterium]
MNSLIIIITIGLVLILGILFLIGYRKKKLTTNIVHEFKKGNTNQVIKICKNIRKKNKKDITANYYLAKTYMKKGHFIQAYDYFKYIINKGLVNETITAKMIYTRLANLATKIGYRDDAVKYNTLLLKMNPDAAENIYFNLGRTYFQNKQFRDAAAALQKSIQYNPDNAECYPYLAHSLYQTHAYEKSLKFFLSAQDNADNDPLIYYRTGQILFYQKKYQKATSYFEKALNHNIKPVKTLQKLANIAFNSNDTQKALDLYEEALKKNKKTKDLNTANELLYEQAELLAQTGDINGAVANWQKIMDIDSAFKDVYIKHPIYAYLNEMQRKDELTRVFHCERSAYKQICEALLRKQKHFSIETSVLSDTIIHCRSIIKSKHEEYDCLSCFNRGLQLITEQDVESFAHRLKEQKIYTGQYLTWYKFDTISDSLKTVFPISFWEGKDIAALHHS